MRHRGMGHSPLRAIICGLLCALFSTVAWAGGRPDSDYRSWFGDFSLGWAFAQGDTADVADDDFTFSGGALFWPSDWPVGIELQAGYTNLEISRAAIRAINDQIDMDPNNSGEIDGGEYESWSFTVNGLWGPGRQSNGLYLTAGIGVFDIEGVLTNTGLIYYPPICSPWYWWWCVPGGFGPGSIVRARGSTTELGWNAGLGYGFPLGDGQLYIEAKYTDIDTPSSSGVEVIPLRVGYRF